MSTDYFTEKNFENIDYTKRSSLATEYENCTFSNCEFSKVDLSGVIFSDCTFQNCDLSMAILTKSAFRIVKFDSCKLLGLHFEDCNSFLLAFTCVDCMINYSSFFKMNLKNTLYKSCILEEVDFSETNLSGAVFDLCDLKNAVFENTILKNADLSTSYNFAIDPEKNHLSKTKFSTSNISGLLEKYDIIIE